MRAYRDPGQMEMVLQDLFGVDLVLPEQFYEVQRGGSHLSGELALMWAVLADGIECFRRTANSAAALDIEEHEETERWMLATDWDSPFSFANLCELFGFDPESLRTALLDWKHSCKNEKPRQRFRPATLRAA